MTSAEAVGASAINKVASSKNERRSMRVFLSTEAVARSERRLGEVSLLASLNDAFALYLDNPLPLLGKEGLDWVWSLNTGLTLEFIPEHAEKIDDARKRLSKMMIDEKVTATGCLKVDDKPDDERNDIPSAFMRSGAIPGTY